MYHHLPCLGKRTEEVGKRRVGHRETLDLKMRTVLWHGAFLPKGTNEKAGKGEAPET